MLLVVLAAGTKIANRVWTHHSGLSSLGANFMLVFPLAARHNGCRDRGGTGRHVDLKKSWLCDQLHFGHIPQPWRGLQHHKDSHMRAYTKSENQPLFSLKSVTNGVVGIIFTL